MKILIIGSDSNLGQAVAQYARGQGHTVIETSRRAHSNEKLFFDLSEDKTAWTTWPDDINAAFIAA